MITQHEIDYARKRVEQFLLTGPLDWRTEVGQMVKTFSAHYGSSGKEISFTLAEPRDGEFQLEVTVYAIDVESTRKGKLSTDTITFSLQAA